MNFKKKNIYTILIILIFFVIIFKISLNMINNTSGLSQKIKYLVPQSIRDVLRETLYKNKYLEIEILKLKKDLNKVTENKIALKKKKLKLISSENLESEKGQKFSILKYDYPYKGHFSWGKKPPGYIASYKNFILATSGTGEIIVFKKNDVGKDLLNFDTIDSNFSTFIEIDNYLRDGLFGIRDISVIKNELFISFVDFNSCNKLSILRGNINFDFINFKKFFSFDGCRENFDGQDNEGLDESAKEISFIGQRSGGRIVDYNDNNILFSIGDYGLTLFPPEAQNLKSLFGSLIKINLDNDNEVEIISKGLRNPQGLYFDIENDLILITDHGPDGGDELNIIDLNKEKFANFGWPISSYGIHYKSTIQKAKQNGNLDRLLKGAPLKKDHIKNGFKEPLIHFSPSIGISEVIKLPIIKNLQSNKDYLIAAMGGVISEGDKTFHHLRLNNDNNKIYYHDKFIINERIRDFYYDKDLNNLVLLLGNTPSIGFVKFKN